MLKRWFIGASAMLMLVGVGAEAAAPELPPSAITKDTTIVSYVDSQAISPDAIHEAAAAVLGANSPMIAQLDQHLGQYKEKYDKALKAGAQSAFIIAETGVKNNPGGNGAANSEPDSPARLYVPLRKGADAQAIQQSITEDLEPAEREKTVFSHEGDYLIMRQKTQKAPLPPDPERAKKFSEALSHSGDAAVTVVFIPDAATRQEAQNVQVQGQAQWIQDAMPVLANSQWGSVAIRFGKMPSIIMTDQAADAASATKLTNAVNAALAQLKQAAQNANAGGAGGGNAMMMFAPLLAPLADALKPTQQDSMVVINLNGQGLATIATTVAQFAPMLGAMGGRPGAAPRRGAPAGGGAQ